MSKIHIYVMSQNTFGFPERTISVVVVNRPFLHLPELCLPDSSLLRDSQSPREDKGHWQRSISSQTHCVMKPYEVGKKAS